MPSTRSQTQSPAIRAIKDLYLGVARYGNNFALNISNASEQTKIYLKKQGFYVIERLNDEVGYPIEYECFVSLPKYFPKNI